MKVHATYHEFAGNDKANVWTISEDPEETGWETDSGCDGYGLSREKAEYYARCINEYPRLISIIEQAERKLELILSNSYFDDAEAAIMDVGNIAKQALQVIRGK